MFIQTQQVTNVQFFKEVSTADKKVALIVLCMLYRYIRHQLNVVAFHKLRANGETS